MRAKILEAIYLAMDDVNVMLKPEKRLQKAPDSPLYGKDSPLDSVNLVQFLVSAEQRLNEALGLELVLASERAFSRSRSPFTRVDLLADFVEELVNEPGAR